MDAGTFLRLLKQAAAGRSTIREIRFRVGRPVLILDDHGENVLYSDGSCGSSAAAGENGAAVIADKELLRGLLEMFAGHSLYAYEREIGQGYLTIRGGHRVGIAGKAVVDGGRVTHIRDVSSLNVRVAREVKGCAAAVLPFLLEQQEFLDTLIVSPPGAGKTTLLRDLIRNLSDGGTWGNGKNVSVVDERSEIAACFEGVPQCDLGMRTDVMDGCPKGDGMIMMLRSMAPQVIAVDEAGREEELMAMKYAMNCGCRILATAHGADIHDLLKRPVLKEMVKEQIFSRYIVLSGVPKPGSVVGIYDERFQLVSGWRREI